MNSKLVWMITVITMFVVQFSFTQIKTIMGVVTTTNTGLPLPGVNVIVKDTSYGTQTDFDGKYTIKANEDDILVFSYMGMKTTEIAIGVSNQIDLAFVPDNPLDEVVVVAYGATTKEAFTGSVDLVRAKDFAYRNITSPLVALEGRATGIQFISPAGPGDSPGIVIRGVGTLNGGTDPLFIVDGVQFKGALNTINQEDIESFTILKDAASTALYGARASNGVVIITTKSGTKGGVNVNFSAQSGFVSNAIPFHHQVSPGQYYEVMWESLRNTQAALDSGDAAAFATSNIYNQLGYNPFNVPNNQIVGLDGQLNPNAQVIYQSLDWFEILQQEGLRQNFNVNIAGGGENHKVFFSASYLDEESYVITSGFERITARINAEFDLNNSIKIGGSTNIALTNTRGPSSAATSSIANPFSFSQNIGSIYPVYVNDLQGNIIRDVAGNPVFDNGEGYSEFNIGSRPVRQGRNAVQELLLNSERDEDNTLGLRLFTDITIVKGLNLWVQYGRDINELFETEYENQIIGDAQGNGTLDDPGGRLSQTRARRDIENFNQIFTYAKSFGKHNLDITLGHESYEEKFSDIDGLATSQTVSNIHEFSNFSTTIDLDGATFEKALEGYFSRLNYNFDGKYYLSASLRRDGSSVFDTDVRWGTFSSVGCSWRMDQEKFMNKFSFVNRLKLRASWGEVGNDDLLDFYIAQARFKLTSNAVTPGILFADIGNPDLTWETVENFDVALEFALFNSFVEGKVEYYKQNSTDLLFNVPIATSNGFNEFPQNIGNMFNSGWEFALTTHLFKNPNFIWDVTLQASTFKNEITFIPEPFINGTKRWAKGQSRYDFFLRQTAGVNPVNGDQLYYLYELNENNETVAVFDQGGNHETTSDWRETQPAYTGDSSIPDLLGSVYSNFKYKRFSLEFLFNYGIGGKVLDLTYASMMSSQNYGNSLHPDILNAWRQPGDITNVPRLENGDDLLVISESDRFLTDASFLTLKNVTLGYTFAPTFTHAIGVDNLGIVLTGENLFLITERRGINPQDNLAGTPSNNDFSPQRIISLGLNVSF